MASSCKRTSPLAVITVVGFLDVVTDSNSAECKSLLLIMCIDAPESTTNSLSSGPRVDGSGMHLFSEGEKNAVLSFSSYFRIFLDSLQAASRAHRTHTEHVEADLGNARLGTSACCAAAYSQFSKAHVQIQHQRNAAMSWQSQRMRESSQSQNVWEANGMMTTYWVRSRFARNARYESGWAEFSRLPPTPTCGVFSPTAANITKNCTSFCDEESFVTGVSRKETSGVKSVR